MGNGPWAMGHALEQSEIGNRQSEIGHCPLPIAHRPSPIAPLRPKVALFTNSVRLARPLRELAVEILKRINPESVQVVSRRERLNAKEARVVDSTSEDKVADEIALAHADRGE